MGQEDSVMFDVENDQEIEELATEKVPNRVIS